MQTKNKLMQLTRCQNLETQVTFPQPTNDQEKVSIETLHRIRRKPFKRYTKAHTINHQRYINTLMSGSEPDPISPSPGARPVQLTPTRSVNVYMKVTREPLETFGCSV